MKRDRHPRQWVVFMLSAFSLSHKTSCFKCSWITPTAVAQHSLTCDPFHIWQRPFYMKIILQVPLAMAYCGNHHTLVTTSADMTLLQWHLDDVPAIKHFTLKSRWPTKHAAMSMCWSSSHRLLYSGTTAGTIQGARTCFLSRV